MNTRLFLEGELIFPLPPFRGGREVSDENRET